MGTLLLIFFTLSNTLNNFSSQARIDPLLAQYLGNDLPSSLLEVENTPLTTVVLYDPFYQKELFGEIPREFLVNESVSGDHIQLVYEFNKIKAEANGYGPTLNIIKEMSSIFGKPTEVQWLEKRINLSWDLPKLKLSLVHLELDSKGVIIVRVDLQNNQILVTSK
ncbi:MAG TPA: hypothetical protein VGA21_08575 [Cyclobacteriaceae bacterium]|jgi:hypothetical protein